MDWERARKFMFTKDSPPGWPPDVRGIALEGLGFLGVHQKTGELYWDGRKLLVQKPVTLGLFERILASLAAVSAVGLLVVEIGRAAGWWQG